MKKMLIILIRKIMKMVTEERFKEMTIKDQSFHLVVVMIRITVREITVTRREAGVVKRMIGTEGVGRIMMTTTVTVDLVIEALVDMMIVIIASTIAGAEAKRIGRIGMIIDEGINQMVSGAIEMDTKRVIVTGEMKSTAGKGAQKEDLEKMAGTARETIILMISPIRREGTKVVDRILYDYPFCVCLHSSMSTCIPSPEFSV